MLRWLSLLATGCAIHSAHPIADPLSVIGSGDDVRLVSAKGARTGWIAGERLVRVGPLICMRSSAEPWSKITAIRVADVTDPLQDRILAGLPESVEVERRGDGELEIETDGEDLSSWLTARGHDGLDREPRYRVQAWGHWSEALTWRELALAAVPMGGWPIDGTRAERRGVNVPATIIATVGAVTLGIFFLAIAALADAPSPFPSDGPREPSEGREVIADASLALVDAELFSKEPTARGTWSPRLCGVMR